MIRFYYINDESFQKCYWESKPKNRNEFAKIVGEKYAKITIAELESLAFLKMIIFATSFMTFINHFYKMQAIAVLFCISVLFMIQSVYFLKKVTDFNHSVIDTTEVEN
jgi:hypothetical protein